MRNVPYIRTGVQTLMPFRRHPQKMTAAKAFNEVRTPLAHAFWVCTIAFAILLLLGRSADTGFETTVCPPYAVLTARAQSLMHAAQMRRSVFIIKLSSMPIFALTTARVRLAAQAHS